MADPTGVEGSQLVDGMCAGAFLKGPPKYHPSSKEGAQLSTLDQIKQFLKKVMPLIAKINLQNVISKYSHCHFLTGPHLGDLN